MLCAFLVGLLVSRHHKSLQLLQITVNVVLSDGCVRYKIEKLLLRHHSDTQLAEEIYQSNQRKLDNASIYQT